MFSNHRYGMRVHHEWITSTRVSKLEAHTKEANVDLWPECGNGSLVGVQVGSFDVCLVDQSTFIEASESDTAHRKTT